MKITYRQLLSAIQIANDLEGFVSNAAADPTRWNGTPEEKKGAEVRLRRADAMLDKEIDWNWV